MRKIDLNTSHLPSICQYDIQKQLIQCKPLNEINLGQKQTDSKNQLKITSELASK
jgi:hypothetical protein